MRSLGDLRIVAAGLDHPEGIALGPDGRLYAGGEAGQIYRLDPESASAVEIATTGGFIYGLCLDAESHVYACDPAAGGILRITPDGSVRPYCSTIAGTGIETPNWACFTADGTLWFTDSGTEAVEVVNGRIARVGPGGGDAELVVDGLHFPNGMCVGRDGTAYVVESLSPRLSVVLDGRTEVIADLAGHNPDGLALCADGGFLVACYYPFRLLYVPSGGGRYDIVLDDPTGIHIPTPTNVAFFGDGLREVAIASLGGQIVKAIDLGIAGAPLSYPHINR